MSQPIFHGMEFHGADVSLRVNTALPPSPLSLNPSDLSVSRDDEEQSKLQEHWDKSIAKHMNLPDGYQNVYVLMIKWADGIDQLGVRQEVDELTKVFANIFGYDVQELELPATNAQLTLNSRVSTWACEHNSTDNLLIVYYAGHGIWDTDLGVLEFAPNNDPSNRNRASWNTCEQQLREAVDADVFGIMDCCYASNLNRNVIELSRTYEMLAASGIDDLTPQPGRNSFTHRLIKHLKELVVDNSPGYFTTRHIEDRMKKDRIGGKVKPPALWCYSSSSRHIRLSKLKPVEERLKRNRTMPSHSRFLHLGFALEREDFDEQNIERLTKALPGILKDAGAPVVDIKWLGCRKVGGRTFKELAEYVLKHRENLSAISPGQSAKRSAEEAGLDELSSCDGGSVMHRGPRPKFVTEATV